MDKINKQKIMLLLNGGDSGGAMAQLDSMGSSLQNDTEWLYLMGLSLLLGEKHSEAIERLEKACQQAPSNAVYLSNLGVACQRAGHFEQAITHLTQSIELNPDYLQARYNLGSVCIDNRQPELAIEQYRELVKREPKNGDYLCALADAMRENGQWKRAVALYHQALEQEEGLARAHTNLGPLLANFGDIEKSLQHCERAVELSPESSQVYKNLGDCLVQHEQLDEAMEAYADAYERDTESADLCVAIGKVWLEIDELGEAHNWFQKGLVIDEEHKGARCGLAGVIKEAGDVEQAIELLEALEKEHPDDPAILLALSDALWDDGDAETALKHLWHLRELLPQRLATFGKIGQILSSSGDVKQAVEIYQTALAENGACVPALSGLATTQRGKMEANHAEAMLRLLEKPALRDGARGTLHNGLAFYFDGNKDFEKAAHHVRESNRLQWQNRVKRGWEYEPESYNKQISRLIKHYDGDYFETLQRRNLGNPDTGPVFIVAMPRSGTTLTEQILARHSKVLGVGERNFASQSLNGWNQSNPDAADGLVHAADIDADRLDGFSKQYLEKLAQLLEKSGKRGVERIVDKMPDNYSQVGWILTLFPNARIIHVKRNPRDVALSCWMTQFGSIRWACHTEHLSERIREYQRIMQHWQQVIPGRIFEFEYEELVANQEQVSRQLIDWIGLEWEPECLEFYDSDRIVRTASITQVRQPIYNKSVEKWKRYESHFDDLFSNITL